MSIRQASFHFHSDSGQPANLTPRTQRALRGVSAATPTKTDAFQGKPGKMSASVQFAGAVRPGKIRAFFQNLGQVFVYGLKRTGAFFNYLGSQVKTALFLFLGVFAFLPLKNSTRQWVERLAVFPPVKVKDLPFKHADSLQQKIKDQSFNLYETVRGKLTGIKNTLGIDASTDHIRLRAWHIPAKAGKPTVLFHQQRASNISYLGPIMKTLEEQGYGVFVYDYPGYGKSAGRASEAAMYKAGLAAAKKLESLQVPVGQQVHMGYSLGAPVASRVAYWLQQQGQGPKAIVLVNGFPSLKKVVQHNLDKRFFMLKSLIGPKSVERVQTRLNSEDYLTRISNVPTLFIHGEKDGSAPVSLVRKLSAAMPGHSRFNQIRVLPGVKHKLKESDYKQVGEQFFQFMKAKGLEAPTP
ncbi:alpha/beta hydrolase [Vampirovibrio chlorellavorus]|uniref:alpha/beta hydrolase n=1 Tax=Vampirovibrio chlorellavorus TaxID=758823 RepID=UPI0026EC3D4C|nr:alpha/beta hydrolase [Vampirovibrio chlorellavorus]